MSVLMMELAAVVVKVLFHYLMGYPVLTGACHHQVPRKVAVHQQDTLTFDLLLPFA